MSPVPCICKDCVRAWTRKEGPRRLTPGRPKAREDWVISEAFDHGLANGSTLWQLGRDCRVTPRTISRWKATK